MSEDTSLRENPVSASATVAFVDLAGFTAIAEVYGDALAIKTLEIFESMVRDALAGYEPPIKWIGEEAICSDLPSTLQRVLQHLLLQASFLRPSLLPKLRPQGASGCRTSAR